MPARMAACHMSGDGSAIEDDADAGALDVQPRGQGQHVGRRRVRADEQHVGQLAVQELLEQPGRVGGQPARRQHGDVTVGRPA